MGDIEREVRLCQESQRNIQDEIKSQGREIAHDMADLVNKIEKVESTMKQREKVKLEGIQERLNVWIEEVEQRVNAIERQKQRKQSSLSRVQQSNQKTHFSRTSKS